MNPSELPTVIILSSIVGLSFIRYCEFILVKEVVVREKNVLKHFLNLRQKSVLNLESEEKKMRKKINSWTVMNTTQTAREEN